MKKSRKMSAPPFRYFYFTTNSGVVFYITVPLDEIKQVYENHQKLYPTKLTIQPWGDIVFEVQISGYKFMISAIPSA
jgi:hypothetical protein